MKKLEGHYPIQEIQSFYNLLIENRLHLSRADAVLSSKKLISESDQQFLNQALEALAKFKPIQYILRETTFYDLKFKVNSSVLIPRVETEELVSWVLNDTQERDAFHLIDIGTGSGCIAVAIAKNRPKATVLAVDISKSALEIAATNALLNHTKIHFKQADIFEAFKLPEKLDIIVSNPPYVRNLEKKQIDPNVINYEPHIALFVDDQNALLFYERIAQLAKIHLKPGGFLFFEINEFLSQESYQLLSEMGFTNIELRNDIFNKPRMLKAIKA